MSEGLDVGGARPSRSKSSAAALTSYSRRASQLTRSITRPILSTDWSVGSLGERTSMAYEIKILDVIDIELESSFLVLARNRAF